MNLNRNENENFEKYLWRIGQYKDNGDIQMNWYEITDLINSNLKGNELPSGESAYRKAYTTAKRFYESVFEPKMITIKEVRNDSNSVNESATEVRINTDGTYSSNKLIEMSNEQAKDPSYILTAHGFDPSLWKLVSARNNIRQVLSKQDGIVTLYASFITARPVQDITLEKIEEFYKGLIDNYESPYVPYRFYGKTKEDSKMLEVPIVDIHFGKMCMTDDDLIYNSSIAKEKVDNIVENVIKQSSMYNIDKIIFPIGNDFFHIDNALYSTTAGTRQNTDSIPQLIFKNGVECIIDAIKKLSCVAPIEVFCVNGNHDYMTSYHALYAIHCFFLNDENVKVNVSTYPRKYIEYGKCLIGFAHGNEERKRIEGIMQVEAAEQWGRTKYKEFHLGHLHSEQTKEVNGIVIRNLSSVVEDDEWHIKKGYVGSAKKCECFIWDKESGLQSILMIHC